jgi:glucokinase
MILAGDVGGTKTNFALFRAEGRDLARVKFLTFPSQEYPSLESMLEQFLAGGPPVEVACLGVAGPVIRGKSRLTNLSWTVDRESVRKACGARAAFLLNDLQALAFSVPFLPREGLSVLQEGEENPRGHVAVIAPGTGLGEAFLMWNGSGYVPVPSEGGHADFAPRDEREMALLRHLRAQLGRVSKERVISGPGLYNVYRFLREGEGRPEIAEVEARLAAEDAPRVIVDEGLARRSRTCREALLLFSSLFGALAGNLALQYLSTGGVVLGGGVPPAILPVLSGGPFLSAFVDKGRFRDFLQNVPVKVILDDTAALLGAARYAQARGESTS